MPLKTIVKVSHLSNLSDARYCAGMGVDLLGFRTIPGAPHYITPEVYQDIRGWISGPAIVAELHGLSEASQIEAVIQAYAPDYFEVTYEVYRRYGEALQLPCIVSIDDTEQVSAIRESSAPILYILAGKRVSCNDIKETAYPVLKKTTSLQALEEHLEEGCFKGFELEGPEAQRPGITNYDELGEILEALDAD